MKPIKCVVVGDGGTGKTCLLTVYAQNHFPEEYVPTIRDNFTMKVLCGDGTVSDLELFDTAGQEEYDKLRPLSYPNTDVILLCFSLIDKDNLSNVTNKWNPELNHYLPNVVKILVGTKVDIRKESFPDDNSDQIEAAFMSTFISPKQGKELQKKVKATEYFEVSAKTRENIDSLFTKAVELARNPPKNKREWCSLL